MIGDVEYLSNQRTNQRARCEMSGWRLWMALCGVLLSVGAMLAMSVSGAEPPRKVLRHLVLYKFKDSVQPEQVQEVIDAFGALPSKINTIIGYEQGTNVSQEGKSDGLTYCFLVTFASEKDLNDYIAHPAASGVCESRARSPGEGRRLRFLGCPVGRTVKIKWRGMCSTGGIASFSAQGPGQVTRFRSRRRARECRSRPSLRQ